MKIFCIGRNYVEHAREMNSEVPTEPMIFMKPPTALNREKFMFYPDFTNEMHYELELVLKVSKNGKSIAEKHASRYYEEIALGIDFCARDLQSEFKAKSWPWEVAKGFDNAAFISEFHPIEELGSPIKFALEKNGEIVQDADCSLMIFSFDKIVSYISKFFTLNKGDLIYTGTPVGVGAVVQGDVLKGYLDGKEDFEMRIR